MKKTTKILIALIIALFVFMLTNTVEANYQIIYQSTATNYVRNTRTSNDIKC